MLFIIWRVSLVSETDILFQATTSNTRKSIRLSKQSPDNILHCKVAERWNIVNRWSQKVLIVLTKNKNYFTFELISFSLPVSFS